MTTNRRPSFRNAINAKCKDCVYDKVERGTWREQVADCGAHTCPLYSVRPVPRSCMSGGVIDPSAVAEISAKLSGPKQPSRHAD